MSRIALHGFVPSKRSRTYRETSELIDATRRFLCSIERRAGDEDAALVGELVRLDGLLHNVMQSSVNALRERGTTWQQIGDELGTTRQAAYMRWGTA